MSRLTRPFLLLSLLCVSLCTAAQLPREDGERMRYGIEIDMRGAYLSGICSMLYEDGMLKAAIVNEFGVSAIAFTYDPRKDKVRIVSATDKLDKWYIRRMLRHDLRECLHCLQQGVFTYENEKRGMTYMFSPQDNPLTSQQ